jgi:hypothetical protein
MAGDARATPTHGAFGHAVSLVDGRLRGPLYRARVKSARGRIGLATAAARHGQLAGGKPASRKAPSSIPIRRTTGRSARLAGHQSFPLMQQVPPRSRGRHEARGARCRRRAVPLDVPRRLGRTDPGGALGRDALDAADVPRPSTMPCRCARTDAGGALGREAARWRAAPAFKPGEPGEALHREPLGAGDMPRPTR